MLSPELAKKIKNIELKTSKIVNTVFCGEYTSAFKGKGMEFDEVREYIPGDDIRNINWNVTARMNAPFIKEYKEERELTLMLLVDLSSSGKFGSSKLKNEVAAEVAALLAYVAITTNDKVGLIIFTDKIELYIPPKKGVSHVWRLIKEILNFIPQSIKTEIEVGMEFFQKVIKRKSLAFVISDFISEDFKTPLIHAAHKHDVISIMIKDPREMELPDIGFIELQDAETGEIILVDTGSKKFRDEFKKCADIDLEKAKKIFKSSNIDHIIIRTDQSPVDPIIKFFKMRSKRL